MQGPQAHWLADGRRLHLNHGPIDLIAEAFGEPEECHAAYEQAVARFHTVLPELVSELPELRCPAILDRPRAFQGSVARRMEAAVVPLARDFLTPMAAVAGAVADEMIGALCRGRRLRKAYVNNGGDSALFIAPGERIDAAVAATGRGLADRIAIRADVPVRGIATSGWRGRSFSLGIADAVTVLARSAAEADAAATVIANAVDLPGHPAIRRQPARDLAPDNDLGERLVTVEVGELRGNEVEEALGRGLAVADRLCELGLIEGAALFLCGQLRVCNFARIPPSGLPDSLAQATGFGPSFDPHSRGEIGCGDLVRNLPTQAIGEAKTVGSISPLEGEMAGGPEGGAQGCHVADGFKDLLRIP